MKDSGLASATLGAADLASMVHIYTQGAKGEQWVSRHQGRKPAFMCVLGFTETALVPGISAAGATPESRRYTAIADAEFLVNGPQSTPTYPLPPLTEGASPVFISRAVLQAQHIPIYLANAGLPIPPKGSAIDLGGRPAQCLSTGTAQHPETVRHLFQAGYHWGQTLSPPDPEGYWIVSECVVGGTTTALAVLTGLGIAAHGKVNSSHPTCNHAQKWQLVQQGLMTFQGRRLHPLEVVAAVGDPMQAAVAGFMLAASQRHGVLLAGGTQMLAVYALAAAIAVKHAIAWHPEQVMVGTTRWVAEDPTGDTVGLATAVDAPLLATQLSFATSRYQQLRAYEQGFVKEGVGAGGCAIAASLYGGWQQPQLLSAIESLIADYESLQ